MPTPRVLQSTDGSMQFRHIGSSQPPRRLVHQQHAGIERQRLHDLHFLLLHRWKGRNNGIKIESQCRAAPIAPQPRPAVVCDREIQSAWWVGGPERYCREHSSRGPNLNAGKCRQCHASSFRLGCPAEQRHRQLRHCLSSVQSHLSSILMSVDLPAPFDPTRARTSPAFTLNSTLSRTLRLAIDLA